MTVTKDEIRRQVAVLLAREPSKEELSALEISADRLKLDEDDASLKVLILYEALNQRVGRVEAMLLRSLLLRDDGFLVRVERAIPRALVALVAIVALAFGYALGAQG